MMPKFKDATGIKPFLVDPAEKWCVLESLVGIIPRYVSGPIVEIGCTYGDSMYHRRKSTNIFAEKAMAAGVPFYTCDIKFQVEIDYVKHTHFMGTSLDFIKQFDQTGLSIVFLDGCHAYDVVMEEFNFFYARLKTGGMIFLHDTNPKREALLAHGSCSDSYRVRQELETRREDMEVFTWPYTAGNVGLTMVLKKETDRPYYLK